MIAIDFMTTNAAMEISEILVYGKDGSCTIQEHLDLNNAMTSTDDISNTDDVTSVKQRHNPDSCVQDNVSIQDPVLAYITFALQSSTKDNIRRAVLGHFSAHTLHEAQSHIPSENRTGIPTGIPLGSRPLSHWDIW